MDVAHLRKWKDLPRILEKLRIFRIRSTLTISLSLVNVKILSFVFCSLSYYLIEEISISLDLRVEPIYLGTVLVT